LLAVTGLLFSGAKVFASVRRGINQAWNIRFQHPFFVARAIDLVLLLAAALLVLMAVLLTTNATGLSIPIDTPEAPGARLVVRLLSELLTLTFTLGIFILLYRYIPNTRVTWRDVWLGALVGCVLLNGFRIGLTWFIATFSGFNLLYGSLGALIAVLVWVYMSSLALMWGAQVAATYSRLFGTLAEAGSKAREA
jgi:membrane protein